MMDWLELSTNEKNQSAFVKTAAWFYRTTYAQNHRNVMTVQFAVKNDVLQYM